jgi:hypothetical protein
MLEGKHGWELWNQLYYLGIKSMLQANAPVASER